MKNEQYKIICLNCKGESRIQLLDGKQVMYIDHTPIISSRLRGDMQFGFECMCGNDNRLAAMEKDQAGLLVQNASSDSMKKIMDSLKIDDTKQFRMERV